MMRFALNFGWWTGFQCVRLLQYVDEGLEGKSGKRFVGNIEMGRM